MKRLFLLRHAEASMNAPSDRERPLTDHGLAQAAALGEDMRRRSYVPDFVYCSPAKRTQETFEKLDFSARAMEAPEHLYNGSSGDLLRFIQNTKREIEDLLIVAHNPGIYHLAGLLIADDNSEMVGRLSQGYPPASLSIIECACEDWAEIQPAQNTLIDLIIS